MTEKHAHRPSYAEMDAFRLQVAGFSITLTHTRSCMLVVVVGDIDATTIFDVERRLAAQPAADVNAIVVDLSRVSFCSAAGISVLLDLLERTNARAVPLTVVVDTHPVRRALEVLDPAKRLSTCAHRAAALVALSTP